DAATLHVGQGTDPQAYLSRFRVTGFDAGRPEIVCGQHEVEHLHRRPFGHDQGHRSFQIRVRHHPHPGDVAEQPQHTRNLAVEHVEGDRGAAVRAATDVVVRAEVFDAGDEEQALVENESQPVAGQDVL